MVFRELVEHLRALSSVEIIADNAVSEITEVRFIDLRQTDFSSNLTPNHSRCLFVLLNDSRAYCRVAVGSSALKSS